MNVAVQALVAMTALPLAILGFYSMFSPKGMSEPFGLEPRGVLGLSTIRSVPGGLFFASVAMIALGLSTGETTWLLAVAILMGAVAFGRVVGISSDGLDKAVLPPLVVELVIGTILGAGHLILGAHG